MIVLDAYAVLALLKGEHGSEAVEELLRVDSAVTLTCLGVAEVVDHLVRVSGVEEDDAVLDLAQLGLDEALPVTTELATRAGLLRARSYHQRTCAVSMADCVAAEAARATGAALATSDRPLLRVCGGEGIRVLALPDSRGRTWSPD